MEIIIEENEGEQNDSVSRSVDLTVTEEPMGNSAGQKRKRSCRKARKHKRNSSGPTPSESRHSDRLEFINPQEQVVTDPGVVDAPGRVREAVGPQTLNEQIPRRAMVVTNKTVLETEISAISADELRNHQASDKVTGPVRQWLIQGDGAPSPNELQVMDPKVQQLWTQRQTLEIKNDILYRRYVRPDGALEFLQVVVPHGLQTQFMDAVHSGAINGHMGNEKIQQIAYWQGWRADVCKYVRRCNVCSSYRHGPQRKQGELQKALACDVMQKVHIDLVGPFPLSKVGYRYVLTVICAFSKYLICVPIRNKHSLTVARALVKHVYLTFSTPSIVVHDQGGEFWSDVMADLAKLLEIQTSTITSHRPNSNGVVERVHATLHRMLAKLVAANQRDWCEMIPYVTFAYNTATHSTCKFCPFYLVFLRQPKMPIELQIEQPTEAAFQSQDDYVETTSERMRAAYAIVRDHLGASFSRAKKRYDEGVKPVCFQVGNFVWYYIPRNRKGLNKKWELCNRGPFKITRKINDVNYVIQKTPRAKPVIAHVDRLTLHTGEIPACWKNGTADQDIQQTVVSEPSGPTSTEIGETQYRGTGQYPLKPGIKRRSRRARSGATTTEDDSPDGLERRPRRRVSSPHWLQGYVRQVVGGKMAAAEMSGELSVSNIVVEKVMPNKLKCPFCFDKCLAERGFRKHVILCHGMRFRRQGPSVEPFPNAEMARQAREAYQRGQWTKKRRQRGDGVFRQSQESEYSDTDDYTPDSTGAGPTARGVDVADPDTTTVAADTGGSRSRVPLRLPVPAPASASHHTPLDEVTKHSTTIRSRQKHETRHRPRSIRSAHREEASGRKSSPETVFGRCYALRDPVLGLGGFHDASLDCSEDGPAVVESSLPSPVSGVSSGDILVPSSLVQTQSAAKRNGDYWEDEFSSDGGTAAATAALSDVKIGIQFPEFSQIIDADINNDVVLSAPVQASSQPSGLFPTAAAASVLLTALATVQTEPFDVCDFGTQCTTVGDRPVTTDATIATESPETVDKATHVPLLPVDLLGLPAGVSLHDVVVATRHLGGSIDYLVSTLLSRAAQDCSQPTSMSERQTLYALVNLVAAARRDQARWQCYSINEVETMRARAAAETPLMRSRLDDIRAQTVVAANWELDDSLVNRPQQPIPVRLADPNWIPPYASESCVIVSSDDSSGDEADDESIYF